MFSRQYDYCIVNNRVTKLLFKLLRNTKALDYQWESAVIINRRMSTVFSLIYIDHRLRLCWCLSTCVHPYLMLKSMSRQRTFNNVLLIISICSVTHTYHCKRWEEQQCNKLWWYKLQHLVNSVWKERKVKPKNIKII